MYRLQECRDCAHANSSGIPHRDDTARTGFGRFHEQTARYHTNIHRINELADDIESSPNYDQSMYFHDPGCRTPGDIAGHTVPLFGDPAAHAPCVTSHRSAGNGGPETAGTQRQAG